MTQTTGRKRKNRSAGEGSTYHDGSRWRGVVTWTDSGGKQERRYTSGATQKEARDKLDVIRRELRLGTLAPVGPAVTVGQFLAEWLDLHRADVRPSTWLTVEYHVRVYLVPTFGHQVLVRLTAMDVKRALQVFVEKGRPGGQPISPVTARHIRATLRAALADAVKQGLVPRNVAADATPPKVAKRPISYLSAPDVRRLLKVTEDAPLGPLFALAATTGLRRGELLGLRWSDVTESHLTVRRSMGRSATGGWSVTEPKTDSSSRTIPLAASAKAALERQRVRQAADRLAAGPNWVGQDDSVFADKAGRPLLPEYVSHAFAKANRAAGGPPASLHDLRHTAATLLLAQGVPLVVISELLGHSDLATTRDSYAAVVPQLHDDAADAMDRALGEP